MKSFFDFMVIKVSDIGYVVLVLLKYVGFGCQYF